MIRLKPLLEKIYKPYVLETIGQINSPTGMKVLIKTGGGDIIGETNIIGYEHALNLSMDLTRFLESKKHVFNNNNFIYQYSLFVNDKYKRQGWASILKNECHNIIKNNGFMYASSIVLTSNHASQGLNKKIGYSKYMSNNEQDLLLYIV